MESKLIAEAEVTDWKALCQHQRRLMDEADQDYKELYRHYMATKEQNEYLLQKMREAPKGILPPWLKSFFVGLKLRF